MTDPADGHVAAAPVPERHSQALWQHIRLFAGLDTASLEAIARRLILRSFGAGEALIQQDRWCGELFILRSGVAQVRYGQSAADAVTAPGDPDAAANEVVLRRLVSGDCFGEMSLITGDLPSATVRAITDGDAWALSQDDFDQLATDYPGILRNINVILSERLYHTSRQHAQAPSQQISVIVAEPSPVWGELARTLAALTGSATLFVDFSPPTDAPGPAFHLADLLSGRLNSARLPEGDGPAGDGFDTIVLQDADEHAHDAARTVPDLLGALSRLEDRYRHVLILVPVRSAHLTSSLIAVATRVLIAGSVETAAALRSVLSALPMPASLLIRPEVGVVLTDGRSAMQATTAMLEKLSEQIGAPVRAIFPAADTDRAVSVSAFARWLAGQRIGLAFGGGGVKGWAHLGVIRVLHRLGVPLDCVAGVSIGAICAAIVARGGTLDEYERLLRLAGDYAFHPKLSRFGLLSSQAVAKFLRRNDVLGDRLIEDLPTPFAAVAADLNTGSEIVIRRGLAWQAVLASASIPALFPPVRIGGHVLVDGAVLNPVPISTAQLIGGDKVIAIDISGNLAPRQEISLDGRPVERLPNMVGSMLRSFEIMGAQIRAHAVEQPSVIIKPVIAPISLRRFKDGVQFIAAGEAAAEAAIPQLYREFPWLERAAR